MHVAITVTHVFHSEIFLPHYLLIQWCNDDDMKSDRNTEKVSTQVRVMKSALTQRQTTLDIIILPIDNIPGITSMCVLHWDTHGERLIVRFFNPIVSTLQRGGRNINGSHSGIAFFNDDDDDDVDIPFPCNIAAFFPRGKQKRRLALDSLSIFHESRFLWCKWNREKCRRIKQHHEGKGKERRNGMSSDSSSSLTITLHTQRKKNCQFSGNRCVSLCLWVMDGLERQSER